MASVTRPSARASSARTTTWDAIELAPVVLVHGAEGLLVERAVHNLVSQAKAADPDIEVTELEAAAYGLGNLLMATSPSLFADRSLVIVRGAESTSEDFITDICEYVRAPSSDSIVIVEHRGGQRGKKMLDAIKASGAPVALCEPIKKDSDKLAFAAAEFRTHKRRADAGAVRVLVEAVGNDLRELGAACSQLCADTTGTITEDAVNKYYGGRVEATGFRVADAAVAGDQAEAVSLLRHALATGLDPVPIVAVLAMKLRQLAKVAAMRGRGNLSAKDLGMAPWQVDRVRKDLTNWTPEGLAAAITAVADADAEVKGGGRDPIFAVERAVLRICAAVRR